MVKHKICCFLGHRNTVLTEIQYDKLKMIVENLIVESKVNVFLFGSKSDFNSICHKIITELKEKYPYIIRKCYTCRSEACIPESERAFWEKIYSNCRNKKVSLLGFEEEVEHKTKYTAGKASYVERNQAMINDSDYCIFYYDENYQPQSRKYSKQTINSYQPKSGTALAYAYAKQKRKSLINVFQL